MNFSNGNSPLKPRLNQDMQHYQQSNPPLTPVLIITASEVNHQYTDF